MRVVFRGLAVAVVLASALSACDPLNKAGEERVGVSIDEQGTLLIIAAPCPEESVASMGLIDPESLTKDGPYNPVYWWRLRVDDAIDGAFLEMPVSNTSPAGTELVVPLEVHFSADQRILASVDTVSEQDKGGGSREFSIDELQPGLILSRGDELLSMEEFQSAASGSCQ